MRILRCRTSADSPRGVPVACPPARREPAGHLAGRRAVGAGERIASGARGAYSSAYRAGLSRPLAGEHVGKTSACSAGRPRKPTSAFCDHTLPWWRSLLSRVQIASQTATAGGMMFWPTLPRVLSIPRARHPHSPMTASRFDWLAAVGVIGVLFSRWPVIVLTICTF